VYKRQRGLGDVYKRQEIIQKSGSWFSYDSNKLGQGRDSVKTILHDNPEMANEIEAKIRAKIAANAVEAAK
jgi:recombination protein RecA